MQRIWWWVLALGGLGSAGYAVLGTALGPRTAYAVAYLLVSALGAVGAVGGALRLPRGTAAAWWWMAAAQLVWLAATVQYVVATVGGAAQTDPAVQDAPYLLSYPLCAVAVLLLLGRDRASRAPGALVDATVLGVGLAVLGWAVLVGPVQGAHPSDPAARLGAAAFLACDVVLVVLLVVLAASSSRATPSTWLALAGSAAGLLADTSYLVGDAAPEDVAVLLSVGWGVGSTLWAAAALHPSAAHAPSAHPAPAFSRLRLAVLVGGVLMAPATLALDLLTHRGTASWPAVVAAAVMSVLVVSRLGLALRATAASLAERELMRQALQHQASHDPLTGLPNRTAVVERLTAALEATAGGGPGVGVLFVDLDGFKAVNDGQGHRAGDEVLRVVAERLAGCLRDGDVAGRWGGDEFVVVLTAPEEEDDDGGEGALLRVARRVVAQVAEPVASPDLAAPATVGASVGAALARRGTARTADEVLHDADTAAYRAKAAGRGRVELSGAVPVAGAVRLPAPR